MVNLRPLLHLKWEGNGINPPVYKESTQFLRSDDLVYLEKDFGNHEDSLEEDGLPGYWEVFWRLLLRSRPKLNGSITGGTGFSRTKQSGNGLGCCLSTVGRKKGEKENGQKKMRQ